MLVTSRLATASAAGAQTLGGCMSCFLVLFLVLIYPLLIYFGLAYEVEQRKLTFSLLSAAAS